MFGAKRKEYWGNNPKFKIPKLNEGTVASSNTFGLLDETEETEEIPVKQKVPPIIVDAAHNFSEVIGILGDEYTFKRMSVGTKIMSSTLVLYEAALKYL